MARPRKDAGGPSAMEKMESAFWSILEEDGYPKLTAMKIVQRAGLNRNSFYYYFAGTDDMARKMIFLPVYSEAASCLLEYFMKSGTESDSPSTIPPECRLFPAIERIRLAACQPSSVLHRAIENLFGDTLLKMLFSQKRDPDPEENRIIRFFIGGFVSLMTEDKSADAPAIFRSVAFFAASAPGTAFARALTKIKYS